MVGPFEGFAPEFDSVSFLSAVFLDDSRPRGSSATQGHVRPLTRQMKQSPREERWFSQSHTVRWGQRCLFNPVSCLLKGSTGHCYKLPSVVGQQEVIPLASGAK